MTASKKIIEIKFLKETKFKDASIKFSTKNIKSETYAYQYNVDYYHQVATFAQRFAYNNDLGDVQKIERLPNGNYVAILE